MDINDKDFDWDKATENEGGTCEMFIDGYCTDLKPKQEGCCGKYNCRRFDSGSYDEGIGWFAAWLVDNAEGEVITEEMLLLWASKATIEHNQQFI
jgi:hypothetical protein